ncbi:MAG TPA: zinc-ribbon and DUF3426 domain-containing protein [Rhodanobacteraceae bacterium]|nr:zinc-ribbon and DUF3426 domain-containing protein [Rhodanobacteraceae bacterium]
MYAQCPECLTIYELDAATLAQAHGTVGCGQCGATFNALPTLTEHLPDEPFENLAVHPSSPAPPILMMAVVREQPPQQVLFKPAPADSGVEAAETDTVDEPPTSFPSFVLRPRHRPAPYRHTWRWVTACVLLALCLGVQLVWAKRKPLTANPATRPWLTQACRLFGCTLPPVRDLAQLQLLSRDVRPHPNVPNALLISATVRNNAPFTQPYPIVSITLSDLDENRIAMRRFRPSEYIADPKVRAAGLAPGATAALMFEVKDPGRNAVAFQFGFQ